MKTLRFILTTVLSLALFSGIQAQDKQDNKKKDNEVTFSVSMDCDHCKKKILNNIPYEKGVTDMKVDLPKKEVWVKFNPKKTDKEKLQKAIEKLGYTVSEVVPEEQEAKVKEKQ